MESLYSSSVDFFINYYLEISNTVSSEKALSTYSFVSSNNPINRITDSINISKFNKFNKN